MATAGWRGIFPGSPDEWSLIAVGEGFASAAQCTTDSLWQPHEGGLRRPGYGHWRESTSVAGKAFGECGEWRMCLRTTVSRLYKNAKDVRGDLCATRRRVGFIWLLWLPEGLPLPRVPKHYEVEWDYTRFPVRVKAAKINNGAVERKQCMSPPSRRPRGTTPLLRISQLW